MLDYDEKRALINKALSSVAENVELLTGQRGNNRINLLMSILHQIAKDCGEQNLPQEIYEACLNKQAFLFVRERLCWAMLRAQHR